MLHVPLRMPFSAYELLALRQHLLRALRKSVLSHHGRLTSVRSSPLFCVPDVVRPTRPRGEIGGTPPPNPRQGGATPFYPRAAGTSFAASLNLSCLILCAHPGYRSRAALRSLEAMIVSNNL